MKLIMSAMNTVRKMWFWDISMYKIMLYAFWLWLASYVPWFSTLNPLIYVWLAVIFLIPVFIKVYSPRKWVSWLFNTALENFHHFRFADAWLFEMWITAVALALYQYIPELRSVDPLVWVAIFLFGFWWLASMWMHQK